MLKKHRIFVEGRNDQIFLRDCFKVWYNCELNEAQLNDFIVNCNGITKLEKDPNFKSYKPRKDLGGVDLIIFDTDSQNQDFGTREKRLEYINGILEKRDHLAFVYLLPDNKSAVGNLESLINSCKTETYKPLEDCWNKYTQCIEQLAIEKVKIEKDSEIYVYFDLLKYYYRIKGNGPKLENRQYCDDALFNLNSDSNPNLKSLRFFIEEKFAA
ncbi:MAG: hypothetical protein IPH93_13325 [Saprospiraceae bacterium]|nr:hypothetical protein [Saprospiraceae bacterium]